MTIRERLQEMTKGATTQVDLDAIVARGLLRTMRAEFPEASATEIMYEWANVRNSITADV